MTHPTGEHASGVKLASGYVEVTAKTHDGMKSVHDELTGIETHAKTVGANSATNMVSAISAAGAPAAEGFTGRLRTGVVSGAKVAADESAMGFGATFIDAMRKTRLADSADFLFNGFKEKSQLYGADAANSFHGRFIQLFAANRIDAAREAEATGQAISGGLKRGIEDAAGGFGLGEAFERASKGVSGLGSKFGEAGEKAGGLGEKLGGLAGPLAMFASPEVLGIGGILAAVGAVGVLVGKVNELGEQWEGLGHQLEISTGATGANLEAMKDQVRSVYGQVTDSMGGVASVVAEVNTAFRDSGEGATAVATQVSKLQSMVGAIDTTTLGTAFRGFNIGGNAQAQQSVIDQLLKTSQDTRLPINLLIEALQRFAPVGDQFGLSMQHSLALMDEFSRAGINPQNTLFALSRAAKDATDKHKDFGSALQDDINAIKNAPTEAAAQEAAKGLFGPTSGRGGAAQIVQAVRGGGLDLDPATLAKLTQADGLVNKTRADTMTWGDQWTLFKHQVSDALQPVSEELHGKVQGALEGVVSWLSAHQSQIVGVITSIVGGAEKIGSGLVEAFEKAKPYITEFISAVEPSVKKLVEAFGPLAIAIGRDLVPVVKALGVAFVISLTGAAEIIPPVLHAITDVLHIITDIANWLHDKVPAAWHAAFDTAKEVIGPVVDAIKEILKDVTALGKAIGETLGGAIKAVAPIFKDMFAGPLEVIKEIGSAIDGLVSKFNVFKDSFGGIGHFLGSAVHDLASIAGHQYGGPIRAQGGLALGGFGGGDIIPALLEPGEHVMTKEEVHAGGGHANIALLRALIRAGIMPDILGSMTGLGAASVGAGYGVSGYQSGGPVSGRRVTISGVEHEIFDVMDRFAGTIKKTQHQFEEVNTSITKITKGTDPLGGLQGLGKTISEVTPQIQHAGQLARQASGVDYRGAASDALGYRPTGTVPYGRVRDLRPHHVGTAIEHAAVIGGHVGDIGAAIGVGPSEGGVVDTTLSGLQDAATTVGNVRDLHGHIGNLRGALASGDHGAALGHAANATAAASQIGKTLGLGGGVADAVGDRINAAANLHFGISGLAEAAKGAAALPILSKVLPSALPAAAGFVGEAAGPLAAGVIGGHEIAKQLDKVPAVRDRFFDKDGKPKSGIDKWVLQHGGAVGRFFEGFAGGGFLPGSSDTDNMLGMIPGMGMFGLAGGEGIVKSRVAQQPWVRALINALNRGYAGGTDNAGAIDSFVSSMSGTPYSQGARNDCSGMASQICNVALGLPPRSSMFTTRNEQDWLTAHGFIMGNGPDGSLRVGWYNHGSAPDDGHTAVTLPDGRHAESGGSHGNFMVGGGAAGAENSEFDHHAYLPMKLTRQGPPIGGVSSGASGPATAISGAGGGGDTGGGSGAGGGSDMLGTFGDIVAGGLRENLIPGFSDPTQWGGVKSAAALMKFLAGATGQPGSPLGMLAAARGTQGAAGLNLFGDLLSGSGSGTVHDIQDLIGRGGANAPSLGPDAASPFAGLGANTVVNRNVTYTGDINDSRAVQAGIDAAGTRVVNKVLNGQRLATSGA